jgi:hypothetical protein
VAVTVIVVVVVAVRPWLSTTVSLIVKVLAVV